MPLENVGGDGDFYVDNEKFDVTDVKISDDFERTPVGKDGYVETEKTGEVECTFTKTDKVTQKFIKGIKDATLQVYNADRTSVTVLTGCVTSGGASWDHKAGTVGVKFMYSEITEGV